MSKQLSGALKIASLGIPVFPCRTGRKTPAFAKWQDWATTDRNKIRSWAQANPTANWGVYCKGITVIDVDVKEDTDGFASLASLEAANGSLPKTLRVKTPSGGVHYYFAGEGQNSVGKLAKGIDTRGEGGYVVAPGGVIRDEKTDALIGEYSVDGDYEVKSAPEWIAEALRTSSLVADTVEKPVEPGERNRTIASIAGTLRRRGCEYETILAAVSAFNDTQVVDPLPISELERIAQSISGYAPQAAEAASDFLNMEKPKVILASSINAAEIPPRKWIAQGRFIRNYLSCIIAPGGVGKSTLSLLDALSITTGKSLSGFEINAPCGVWVYNAEDPMEELERRLVAISSHHQVELNKVDNLHLSSGREDPLIFVKAGRDGLVINHDAADYCVDYILRSQIGLFLLDPFIRLHEVPENDNGAIDKVVWVLQRIADRTGCAVCVVHHTRKTQRNDSGAAGNMDMSRGASSLTSAARIAHTLTPMTNDEADLFGISHGKAPWYFRFDSAKANLSPPAECADWYIRKSVTLPNGDDVGSLERVDLSSGLDERLQIETDTLRREIAPIIHELVPEDGRVNLKTLAELCSARVPHVFDVSSEKRIKDRLIALLQEPLYFNGMSYSYVCDKDGRSKHWVHGKQEAMLA